MITVNDSIILKNIKTCILSTSLFINYLKVKNLTQAGTKVNIADVKVDIRKMNFGTSLGQIFSLWESS